MQGRQPGLPDLPAIDDAERRRLVLLRQGGEQATQRGFVGTGQHVVVRGQPCLALAQAHADHLDRLAARRERRGQRVVAVEPRGEME
ncbi:hypothetical protein DM48_8109 [Burkholderia gladioli]|uniref:Uncharacterized protein n=1 Tax=Burkholderia gladioli TaxID=28095 RepID=A0AAW3FCZ0_BURGA|nr:hypothetical protein DM48_8109 [Burkholderia gladioli]